MNINYFLALPLACMLVGCADVKNPVYLMGIDKNGKNFEVAVEASKYSEILTTITNNVSEATLPAVEGKPESPKWILNAVVVGIGFEGTVGVGPFVEMGANAGMRFGFTNLADNPPFP